MRKIFELCGVDNFREFMQVFAYEFTAWLHR